MPLFEYKCSDCNAKFEVLHKSTIKEKEVTCPSCNSVKIKKLFSSFSASVSSGSEYTGGNCATGNCGIPDSAPMGGCSSGMCGLN
ncbi:MAG: zinc ribbon domain-containing protein [Ignavibacteria bacterium]|nr:zinc ribbon domain-containing protein [Ignavibacteria bacterium]MBT8381407.1 zinc ribbon domain-containing protein [Ignavibacteria bacterium]NNL21143.1 zinc ribbon domain-containing protein [Ignavibacteriaceae bacterium]